MPSSAVACHSAAALLSHHTCGEEGDVQWKRNDCGGVNGGYSLCRIVSAAVDPSLVISGCRVQRFGRGDVKHTLVYPHISLVAHSLNP